MDLASEDITVSVCVQTYNHVSFIQRCIDSILSQECDFRFEIILGEDESQDGTRESCIRLAQEHDEIVLFLRDRKDVIMIDGRPSGRFNLIENLSAARGEFIALLEGDDYWNDPKKLQKQVDYLRARNDYFAVTSDTYYLKGRVLEHTYMETKRSWLNLNEDANDEVSFLAIATQAFPHTSTWLFRNELRLPSAYRNYVVGDVPLFLFIVNSGKVGYLNEVMSVYRMHEGGLTNTLRASKRLEHMRKVANMLQDMIKFLKPEHAEKVPEAIRSIIYQTVFDFPTLDAYYAARIDLRQLDVSMPNAGSALLKAYLSGKWREVKTNISNLIRH